MNNSVQLNEFDKEGWLDVCRDLKPNLTDEEYEAKWAEFQEMKRRKSLQ